MRETEHGAVCGHNPYFFARSNNSSQNGHIGLNGSDVEMEAMTADSFMEVTTTESEQCILKSFRDLMLFSLLDNLSPLDRR